MLKTKPFHGTPDLPGYAFKDGRPRVHDREWGWCIVDESAGTLSPYRKKWQRT